MNVEMKKLIVSGLRDRSKSKSQAKMAAELDISAAQFSNVMSEKFDAVSDQLWAKLMSYLGSIKLPKIETQNYTNVLGICKEAQNRKRMIAISADTGLGKTTALKAYFQKNESCFYMLCTSSMSSREFSQNLCIALGLIGGGSASKCIIRASEFLNRTPNSLLIFDDCGKLGAKSWPLIQEIRDRTEDQAGIVVAGMPYLRKYIMQGVNQGWSGFSEIYRRIGYWQDLRRPTLEEVATLCSYVGVVSKRTVTSIHKWVDNFGLLNELLENAMLAAAAGNDINDMTIIRALQVGDAHLSN